MAVTFISRLPAFLSQAFPPPFPAPLPLVSSRGQILLQCVDWDNSGTFIPFLERQSGSYPALRWKLFFLILFFLSLILPHFLSFLLPGNLHFCFLACTWKRALGISWGDSPERSGASCCCSFQVCCFIRIPKYSVVNRKEMTDLGESVRLSDFTARGCQGLEKGLEKGWRRREEAWGGGGGRRVGWCFFFWKVELPLSLMYLACHCIGGLIDWMQTPRVSRSCCWSNIELTFSFSSRPSPKADFFFFFGFSLFRIIVIHCMFYTCTWR